MSVRKVLEDGTHVYSNYTRYKPKNAYPQRQSGEVRFGTKWFKPMVLLEDALRLMPLTRPDSQAYEHMTTRRFCSCEVCVRPQAERWKKRWLKDNLRLGAGFPDPGSLRH